MISKKGLKRSRGSPPFEHFSLLIFEYSKERFSVSKGCLETREAVVRLHIIPVDFTEFKL